MEQERAETAAFRTTDIALAAWLKAHSAEGGIKFLEATNRSGKKFLFLFDDPKGEARQLAVDFVNSECHRYDSEMRALKLICHRR